MLNKFELKLLYRNFCFMNFFFILRVIILFMFYVEDIEKKCLKFWIVDLNVVNILN